MFPRLAGFLRRFDFIATSVGNKWHFDAAKEIILARQSQVNILSLDLKVQNNTVNIK